jgi:peptide/nickel transport system permease protein
MATLASEPAVPTDQLDEPRRAGRDFIRALLSQREGKLGLGLGTLMTLVIIVGPLMAPYSPVAIGVGPSLHGPNGQHLLGTDDFGRDIFSRVLSGGRGVVGVALAATALAFLLGVVVGIVAAYRGGLLDAFITRVIDVMLSLPPLLVVLIVVAGLGSSAIVQIVTIAAVFVPRIARVTRGTAQTIATNEYVEIARLRGDRALSIAGREILPNMTGMLGVEFAVRFTYAILFVATLNFLGVGAQPPSPNWGLMVSDGRELLGVIPLDALAPAACIALVSIALNLIADAGAHALAHEVDVPGELFRR